MPSLICSVQNCVYNHAMYCGKGDIMVGGEEAVKCQDTCCESFCERRMDSAQSSMGTANQDIQVDCKATQCVYNENMECMAGKVTIAGAGAAVVKETECVTFEQKREQ